VWVNGWCVQHHEGGYYPFREDITDVCIMAARTPSPSAWSDESRRLVLRRRGHLPPRLAGQDRAGGHRPDEFSCRVNLKKTFRRAALNQSRSQPAQFADQCRRGDSELRNHFARRQIAEKFFRIGKLKRDSERAVKLETKFRAGSLVAGVAETLQTYHHGFI